MSISKYIQKLLVFILRETLKWFTEKYNLKKKFKRDFNEYLKTEI